MTITTKPKPSQPDEAEIKKLIEKGGRVAAENHEAKNEYAKVLLRLPTDMLEDIDKSVKRRKPVRISRQSWIIEALYEKLIRDNEIS